jgi:hypothetical protein
MDTGDGWYGIGWQQTSTGGAENHIDEVQRKGDEDEKGESEEAIETCGGCCGRA